MSDFWDQGSPTNEDRLRQWCIDGKTSGEIEALFEYATTCNAIIGKAQRRGFKWKNSAGGGSFRQHHMPRAVKVEPLPPVEEPINGLKINGHFIGILTVDRNMCHWPIGDPLDVMDPNKFHYCGRPGYPYCEAHTKKAGGYRKPQPITRKAGGMLAGMSGDFKR